MFDEFGPAVPRMSAKALTDLSEVPDEQYRDEDEPKQTQEVIVPPAQEPYGPGLCRRRRSKNVGRGMPRYAAARQPVSGGGCTFGPGIGPYIVLCVIPLIHQNRNPISSSGVHIPQAGLSAECSNNTASWQTDPAHSALPA